jgi:hypothetical protein
MTHLATLIPDARNALLALLHDYMNFRREVDSFQQKHFGALCSARCFQSRQSACCGREGIVTFFADVVINALHTDLAELEWMLALLERKNDGYKCIYLGGAGCLWRIKPLICLMFVCDRAQQDLFGRHPHLAVEWQRLKAREKSFRWPDRPVLFDHLEAIFMAAGHTSPLMVLHQSPGLLRVKRSRCRAVAPTP